MVESIKIEISRQSETILGVDLIGLYPRTPLGWGGGCLQCVPRPPAASLESLTM